MRLLIDEPPRIVSARIVEAGGRLFLEADVTDAEDGDLAMKVEERAPAGKWREIQAQQVSVGAGPFTWELGGTTEPGGEGIFQEG